MSDQPDTRPADPEYLIVGQIVAPFGVRGEMKVNVLTEFPDRFMVGTDSFTPERLQTEILKEGGR